MDLNRLQLIGNVTRDPEQSKDAAPVKFAVATNYKWKDRDDEEVNEATFHDIVVWGKMREVCMKYLRKGMKVYVDGRVKTEEWTNDDGDKRKKNVVVMERMIMLSSRKKSDSTDQPTPKQQVEAQGAAAPQGDGEMVNVEEIPF